MTLFTAPRECVICGDLAAFECKECYQVHGAGLNTIAFCEGCKKTVSGSQFVCEITLFKDF